LFIYGCFFFPAKINEHPPLSSSKNSSHYSQFEDFDSKDSSCSSFYNKELEEEFEYIKTIVKYIRQSKSIYLNGNNIKKEDPQVFIRINLPEKKNIFLRYKTYCETLVYSSQINLLSENEDPPLFFSKFIDENTEIFLELSPFLGSINIIKEINNFNKSALQCRSQHLRLTELMSYNLYIKNTPLFAKQKDIQKVNFSFNIFNFL
jgi:valyl-tRNA synthetase